MWSGGPAVGPTVSTGVACRKPSRSRQSLSSTGQPRPATARPAAHASPLWDAPLRPVLLDTDAFRAPLADLPGLVTQAIRALDPGFALAPGIVAEHLRRGHLLLVCRTPLDQLDEADARAV